MKASLLAAMLVAPSLGLASPAAATRMTSSYTSLTVFGDSLVDAGNIYALTGGQTPSPAAGYFQGRFTNGYDYTDLLSIDLFGRPTTASLLGGRNFAFGGARIVDNGDVVPDLSRQIDLYEVALGRTADGNGLYVLNAGGNDVFGAIAGTIGGADPQRYLQDAASQYAASVQRLDGLGVRNILITDFPVATAGAINTQANAYLDAALGDLKLSSDTTLYRFSFTDFFNQLSVDPARFGLPALDLTTTCQAAGAAAIASGCAGYFSFDGTHPTAAVQRAAYQEMNRQFALAVPEPTSWMLMLTGFALVGMAARRRGRGVLRLA